MKAAVLAGVVIFAVAISVPDIASAQTNSWINSSNGAWENPTNWSLLLSPTNTQSVVITNDVSKTITVSFLTALSYSETMTVSNLILSAPAGATNMLALSNSGTTTPLSVLDTFTLSAGGLLRLTGAALWMRTASTNNVTNSVLSVDGFVELDSNAFLIADTGIYVGLGSSATGSVLLSGGNLILTNTGPSAVGINGSGELILSNGQIQTSSGYMFVGSGIGSHGTLTIAGGNYIFPSLGRLVVGMETGAVGAVSVTGGNLVMTNSFITLIGSDGAGQINLLSGTNTFGAVEIGGNPGSAGTLTVGGGAVNFQSAILLGSSPNATGTIWLTGGTVVQTNSYLVSNQTNFFPACIAPYGDGLVTVSNGNWLGCTMLVGLHSIPPVLGYFGDVIVPAIPSHGTVNVEGGAVTLLSKLILGGTAAISNHVVGNCASGGVGVVRIDGGSLYVTNAAHNAFLDLRDGQLILNSGLLQVDKLVMTNVCGLFVRLAGTLNVGSSVLGTNLDADGDGMLNGWEQSYGLDPLDGGDANSDKDGDGLSNLQEFLAGTDPTNSASSLRIISILPEGDDVRITWSVVTGKTYKVQAAADVTTNAFADLVTVIVPAAPAITQTNYLDVGAATNSTPWFYKVKLVTP